MHRAVVLSFVMILVVAAIGCGAPVEAKPTEVTYYYLPG